MMKVHYPAESVVSIWAGVFATEEAFDQAVNIDVAGRLALPTPIESICEVTFEQESAPLAQLFEGFSGWESFLPEAESVANNRGIKSANAALVCYCVRIEDAPELWGRLFFLGTFAGQDVK